MKLKELWQENRMLIVLAVLVIVLSILGIVGTGTAALAAAFVANALWPIPTTISPLGSWHSSTAEVECS